MGSTLTGGAKTTWRGQASVAEKVQSTLNRISRATLGALPSTPVAFLRQGGGICQQQHG